jgi:hypothetical protein
VRESISIVTPAAEGDVLRRCVAELAASPPTAAHPATALALLAAGRFDLVAPLIRSTAARSAPDLLLIAGSYVAWSGDLAAAAAAWHHLRSAAATAAAAERAGENADMDDDARAVLTAATFSTLERIANDLGDPQLAATLHGAGRSARARLASLTLRPEAASLAMALNLLEPGPGSDWIDPDPARAVLGFVHAALGVQPDAPRHRLRLRPRVAGPGAELHVRELACGDAAISFEITAGDDTVTIAVRQDAGAIPLTLLLEPALATTAVLAGARVDGTAAALLPRATAGALVVPVQLVLDADRELCLLLDARRPPT